MNIIENVKINVINYDKDSISQKVEEAKQKYDEFIAKAKKTRSFNFTLFMLSGIGSAFMLVALLYIEITKNIAISDIERVIQITILGILLLVFLISEAAEKHFSSLSSKPFDCVYISNNTDLSDSAALFYLSVGEKKS